MTQKLTTAGNLGQLFNIKQLYLVNSWAKMGSSHRNKIGECICVNSFQKHYNQNFCILEFPFGKGIQSTGGTRPD